MRNFQRFSQASSGSHSRWHDCSKGSALAEDFLTAVAYQFSQASFTSYIQAFQQVTVLKMAELWMLIPVHAACASGAHCGAGPPVAGGSLRSLRHKHAVRSLQEIKQTSWKIVIEPLILFDQVLREDPAGAYPRMDYETRELYRKQLVSIADRSDCSEMKVASEVLALARQAQKQTNEDPRVTLRDSHVGSYLVAEGSYRALEQRVGFHSSLGQRLRTFLLEHPDEFYLPA